MTYIYEELNTSRIARRLYADSYASWHENYAACEALAEYLENIAQETGKPMELDIVAIRCDFSLYKDISELNKEYGEEFDSIDALEDYAQVIRVDDGEFITDFSGR